MATTRLLEVEELEEDTRAWDEGDAAQVADLASQREEQCRQLKIAPPLGIPFWVAERDHLKALLKEHIQEAAEMAARAAVMALARTEGIEIAWDLVNERVREWAAKYTYELVSGITDTSQALLQDKLTTWIASGEHLDKLVDALNESGMWGAVRAEMIGTTEVTRAYAEGNRAAWTESGVVDSYRYRTGADDIVCEICQPFEGDEFPLDDVDHSPPLHTRCRCFLQPVVNV